ncbi:MAG TPA: septum site-determining protein MinC [Clostridiales bacterium UBA8960]|nr:septum site-determining protein MinC [Clostridiales bacterium UBA8960]
MAQKGPVEFKGKFSGLYLNVDPNENFDIIVSYLTKFLEDKGSFYRGSRIIGLKGPALNYKQKAIIETIIYDQFGIEVESLEEPITRSEPAKVEPPKVEEKEVVAENVSIPSEKHVSDTHFVFGTMRSGKSVHFPGHVVVIGDVNPGAEIVAEGNIIVMGRVFGFIHAGSAGNDKSVVIASLLKPTQIRISKYISVPPSDDETIHTTTPEKATVNNGVIKIEKCH